MAHMLTCTYKPEFVHGNACTNAHLLGHPKTEQKSTKKLQVVSGSACFIYWALCDVTIIHMRPPGTIRDDKHATQCSCSNHLHARHLRVL
eukprot:scaffold155743_cov19-Tisochrysis_lutea.AAC.2